MKKQDQATAINEMDLKDPHQLLPDELFCLSLSFLSPSDIANSSAVSRDWRSSSLADSTLYSEVDLSEPTWLVDQDQSDEEQLDEQMQLHSFHFNRLSSLSLHKLVKVSINLACFLPDFKDHVLGGVIQQGSRLNTILSTFDLSESSLKEVSIQLNFDSLEVGENPDCLRFCSSMLGHFTRYSKLKKLVLEAALCCSLEAVNPLGGGKSFVLRKGGFDRDDEFSIPNASDLCSFMKEATELVGSGLTHFSLDDEVENLQEEWYHQIILELLKSRETLKTIYMDEYQESFYNTTGAWNLLMSCPNLHKGESLRLQVGVGERISREEAEQATSYRRVLLNTNYRWDSMLKWVGNGRDLEILQLWAGAEEEEHDHQYDPSLASPSLDSILHNAAQTLRKLDLSGVGSPGHQFLPTPTLGFPNLESLSLFNCSLPLWSSFSELRSPKLHSLEVSVHTTGLWTNDYMVKQHQECFNCLVSLMKNSTLTSVKVRIFEHGDSDALLQAYIDSQDPTPQFSFAFAFPQLQHLNIISCAVSKWFSRHHYPNLQHLSVRKDQKASFKNIPPNLKNQT